MTRSVVILYALACGVIALGFLLEHLAHLVLR
jgi:hypothetical protein